ncbi:MAG: hypothetical protein V1875_01110 [Candidatus Altiarchaeota archaeon]
MGAGYIFVGALRGLLAVIKGALMPSKGDFLGGFLITIVVYLVFGISVVLLLPFIIAGVLITYVLRRLWKALILYWTIRCVKKKTSREFERIKGLFK